MQVAMSENVIRLYLVNVFKTIKITITTFVLTDKTVMLWDTATGGRIKKLKGHTSIVNSCSPARRGPQLVCSGSDDGTVKLWDARKKGALQTFQNTYQVIHVVVEYRNVLVYNSLFKWCIRVFSNGVQN